jgi:chromosome segregation ATPase
MNKLKRAFVIAAVALFGSALSVPALAYAHSESDSGSGSSNSGSSEKEDSTSGDPAGTETQKKARELTERFKKTAQEQKEELKDKVKEKSSEVRQKNCEVRKTAIEKRLASKVERVKKHKEKFDHILTRVMAFHDEKDLKTTNYDSLVAAAQAAQADASAQVGALESLDVTVDCTNSNVTDSLSTFRAALVSTRESLKTYRAALRDLIKAVHQSAEDVKNSSEAN